MQTMFVLRTPNKTTSRRAILCSFTSRGERCATRIDTVDIRTELTIGIISNEIIKRNKPHAVRGWPRFQWPSPFQEVEGWIC
jgi:hypothetical protein